MKGNILVLEHEFGPREALRLILSEEHQVLTASTGERALRLLAREPVDVMTMAMLVPDFEGCELLRVIRKRWERVQVIVVTGNICLETASRLLREGVSDIIAKPFHPIEIQSVVGRALARKRSREQSPRGVPPFPATVRDLLRGEPTVNCQPFQTEGNKTDPGALQALVVFSKAIETGHVFSRGHSERVCGYLKIVCQHFPMKPRQKEELEVAALLHDIGKFSLPYQRIYKNAPLNDEDWAMVRLHPQKSVDFIRAAGLGRNIESIIRHHHERYDGSGYPGRLKGANIPLPARLLAIADAIEAMKSRREYRAPMGKKEIIAQLKSGAGRQFDPELTEIFLEFLPLQGDAKKTLWVYDNRNDRSTRPAAFADKEGIQLR